jgi:GH35 family endo-1,4-beta-xylanase
MKSKIVLAIIVFLLLINFVSSAQTKPIQPPPAGTRLKDIPAGPKIGVIVYHGEQYDPGDISGMFEGPDSTQIQAIVDREYNLATATCYPGAEIWPGSNIDGPFNFRKPTRTINWLTQKNKLPVMHLLCGPNIYFPYWFNKGNWSTNKLDSILKNWIYSIMESNDNKNKVKIWNVVNETLNDDGTFKTDDEVAKTGNLNDTLNNCKWYKMGSEPDASGLASGSAITVDRPNPNIPVYIRKAIEYAADKTDNILELRDYAIEFNGPKAKAFYQLVKHLLNKGVKLGAVGLQCHFDLGNYKVKPVELAAQVKLYTSLGLQVYFTELDVNTKEKPLTAATEIIQRNDFYAAVKVAAESGVSGINIWGLTDDNLYWLPNGSPVTFAQNFKPKKSYEGVQKALQDAVYKYDTLSSGTYILTAKHSGKSLAVKLASTTNGATVYQYTNNNASSAQQWQIKHVQGGYHKVIAVCSGKALDVSGVSYKDGALLQQYTFGNGDNQLWKFEKQINGAYKISARHSGKALDVTGVSQANEALVQQYKFGGGDNQLWILTKINNIAARVPPNNTQNKFQLYPNPGHDLIKVNYNNKGEREAGLLQTTNSAGKIIQQKKIILQNGININNINTSGWIPGTYIIELSTSVTKKQIMEKLIVQ